MSASTTPCTVAGSKPCSISVSASSREQKSRRDSSTTAAVPAVSASADCPGASGRLRGLFLNTLRRRHHLDANLLFDLRGNVGVLLQIHARIVLALTDPLAVVAVPGSGLVDDFAFARDAGAIHDLELSFAKWRRHLVLDDLDTCLVADHFLAVLDGTDAADVEPNRSIEFQRLAAGGGFRIAQHDPYLHPYLIDEDHHRIGALDVAGEFAQRLRH